VDEPNSFGNPGFLKDLKSINDPLPATDAGQQATVFQKRSDLSELPDLAARNTKEKSTATAPPKEIASSLNKVDEVVRSLSSELAAAHTRREPRPRKTDLLAAALGLLVIASALLLGTLVGWRQGWQEATLALRASSPRYRASASFKPAQIARTLPAGNHVPPNSDATDECGQSAAAGPATQPPSGGLTVCQAGQIIFRLPASAPLPTRDLRSAQQLPASQPALQQR
jgi:hypothetical protein